MEVINLPFSQNIGITTSDLADYMLMLHYNEGVMNHLKSIHASASFALAETCCGYLLNKQFSAIANQTVPLLRSSCVKYKKRLEETMYANAAFKGTNEQLILDQLYKKHKVFVSIESRLYDAQHNLAMIGEFEWYITLSNAADFTERIV